jgi:hypothetical protein
MGEPRSDSLSYTKVPPLCGTLSTCAFLSLLAAPCFDRRSRKIATCIEVVQTHSGPSGRPIAGGAGRVPAVARAVSAGEVALGGITGMFIICARATVLSAMPAAANNSSRQRALEGKGLRIGKGKRCTLGGECGFCIRRFMARATRGYSLKKYSSLIHEILP